jgi:peroxiredoxin
MNIKSPHANDVLTTITRGLPEPIDDGSCSHLAGKKLPDIKLPSTNGTCVDLTSLSGWVVLYIYPMTGKPGVPIPDGWAEIPGAAGCTPQSCSYRDNFDEFRTLDVTIYGVSAQPTLDQVEAAERLSLPYELLSDSELKFASSLNLPIFEITGLKLLKRVTLICSDGLIKKLFYQVFPPDKNAFNVIEWLKYNAHNEQIQPTPISGTAD